MNASEIYCLIFGAFDVCNGRQHSYSSNIYSLSQALAVCSVLLI